MQEVMATTVNVIEYVNFAKFYRNNTSSHLQAAPLDNPYPAPFSCNKTLKIIALCKKMTFPIK